LQATKQHTEDLAKAKAETAEQKTRADNVTAALEKSEVKLKVNCLLTVSFCDCLFL
jgi:hypothetical protein